MYFDVTSSPCWICPPVEIEDTQDRPRRKGRGGIPKPIVKLDLCGVEVKTYPSIGKAADEHGITPAAISQVLTGLRQTSGGFKWMYA